MEYKRRKIDDKLLLSFKELKPFKVYKTIYTYMLFKKIDNTAFMSVDNKTFSLSNISFLPNDKVFIEYIPGDRL